MKITPVAEAKEPVGITPQINQPTTNEKPAEAPAVQEKKPADPISLKYAELAKREKILRNKIVAREEALKARESALAQKEAQYASSYIEKSKIPDMFQRDPYQALRDLNLSGDQLTEAFLKQPSAQDLKMRDLETEIKALKGALGENKQLLETREEQQRTQALNQIRADIKDLINLDDQYAILKATGSEDAVVKHIEEHFDKQGTLISNQDAAKIIEDELTEELVKYAQIPKILERLKKVFAEGTAPQKEKQQPAPSKTLAHSQVSTSARPMSPRERAIALLEGTLTT